MTAECERTRRHLSAHLEGTLPRRDARRVAGHLARCPECGPVFASLARAVDALRTLGHGPTPVAESAVPGVLARISEGPRPRRSIAVCLEPRSLRRTVAIALVVGVVLTSINQADVLLAGAATSLTFVKVVLNFVVPFVVSNLGLLAARP